MQKVLITRPFTVADNVYFVNASQIARCLTDSSYDVVQDTEYVWHDWEDFDIVYLSPYVIDNSNLYCVHYMHQLRQSIVNGRQERWAMDDDSVMLPMRVTDHPDEYTRYMRLPLQPSTDWVTGSTKPVAKADWWLHYDKDVLLKYDNATVTNAKAKYFGYAKPDREERLDLLGVDIDKAKTYTEYCTLASQSLALIMMNSPSHYSSPTPRFVETMYLSVAAWPVSVNVYGYLPPPSRVFETKAELDAILYDIASMTLEQRQSEIEAQREAVDKMYKSRISICN